MATVTVKFTFEYNGKTETESYDFESSSSLQYDVDGYADERIDELNDEYADSEDDKDVEWDFECTGKAVECFDDDYPDPDDFGDLDDYGLHVDLVDEHGEGFQLRYADLASFDGYDFRNQYHGCYHTLEEWAREVYEDCYNIPDHLQNHIDWESVASELSMGYSVYEGSDGFHVFRD